MAVGARSFSEPAAPARAMLKALMRSDAAQALAAQALGLYLAVALRTTRWTILGEANATPLFTTRPGVVAFWHECLPLMAPLWWRARRVAARTGGPRQVSLLVSRHRDGRLIGAIMRRFQTHTITGSSSRGGAAGLRACVKALADGHHIVITPDGPRGPRRVAAAGVAQIAALGGAIVLPAAAATRHGLTLATWDRMRLPLPFGRGVIVCASPIAVPRGGVSEALPAIQSALITAMHSAEAWCHDAA